MIDIRPEYLTLTNLLNQRLFQIPGYQRAYSWNSRQREDLFNDIKSVFQKSRSEKHFMATIVCLRRKEVSLGTDIYDQLDIVDGQQRLTTLILLLNALKLRLDSENSEQNRVIAEISELLLKAEGDNLLLLQTNHDSSHYFSDFIRYGKTNSLNNVETLADRNLLDAILECQKFIAEWLEERQELVNLYSCIKNRLSFILHEISDEKLVYTVFEVLNSRGMEVSWLDRLKSILMGKAFELENTNRDELISDLHNIWRDIYSQIGLRQGLNTEALRFAATLYRTIKPNRPLNERDSVDEFRMNACDAKSIRKVARWILSVTEACDRVTSNRRQNAVTRISQARLMAVAIYLRDDVSASERDKLLSMWEKVSFRIYDMNRCDARTRVGDYVRLAWKTATKQIDANGIQSEIQSIGKDFPIEAAVQELENANCYNGWEHNLRYLMFRYEEHLSREEEQKFSNEQWERIWSTSPSKSIEHIIPQRTAPESVKHTLGNLMILPPKLNSKLKDKHPNQKLEAYEGTGLFIAKKVASEPIWTEETVRKRECELLKWATDEWAD